jgi:hypothetical protein
VAEGWVTAERAERTYGVVLGGDGSVDQQATAARRAQIRGDEWPPRSSEDPVLSLIAPGAQLWPTSSEPSV